MRADVTPCQLSSPWRQVCWAGGEVSVNKSPVEAEGRWRWRWSQYSHHVIRRGEKHGRIFASSHWGIVLEKVPSEGS